MYTETGSWTLSTGSGYNNGNYHYDITGGSGGTATWSTNLASGNYDVFVQYRAGGNRPTNTVYGISHLNGSSTASIDQTQNNLSWVLLGNYDFNGAASVTLDAAASTPSGKAAIADSVRFLRVGNVSVPDPDITNPGFESANLSGWTTWTSSWSGNVSFGTTGFTVESGNRAAYWLGSNVAMNGGLYQTIDVQAGGSYTIEAMMRRYGPGADQWIEFGYDLSGGTNPEAPSVVYTKLEGQGYNTWNSYNQTVTATGNQITLFAKGGVTNAGGGSNYFYLDSVSVSGN